MNLTVAFEYDPYKLIEAVRKRPAIWNYENKEFRKHVRGKKIWQEVVTELVGNDVSISKSDMKELELELQKKWKGMRDNFRRYSANPKMTKRPYIYFKQMQFLSKKDNNDVSVNNTPSESDEHQNKKKGPAKIKFKYKKARGSSEGGNETVSNDTFNASDIVIDVPQKTENPNTSRPIDEFVFANVDSHIRNDNDDPDKMFLLSLLPHLKAVPEPYRLNVKMDLMQVLRSASFMSVDQKIL